MGHCLQETVQTKFKIHLKASRGKSDSRMCHLLGAILSELQLVSQETFPVFSLSPFFN